MFRVIRDLKSGKKSVSIIGYALTARLGSVVAIVMPTAMCTSVNGRYSNVDHALTSA